MGGCVVSIYWLQSATPIRHLDFWFPTASLALTLLVWAATLTQAENNSYRSLISITIIAAILNTPIIITIGLTRYQGPLCCLTPSRPPDILKIAVVIALVSTFSVIIVKLFPKSRHPTNLLIILILCFFLY